MPFLRTSQNKTINERLEEFTNGLDPNEKPISDLSTHFRGCLCLFHNEDCHISGPSLFLSGRESENNFDYHTENEITMNIIKTCFAHGNPVPKRYLLENLPYENLAINKAMDGAIKNKLFEYHKIQITE